MSDEALPAAAFMPRYNCTNCEKAWRERDEWKRRAEEADDDDIERLTDERDEARQLLREVCEDIVAIRHFVGDLRDLLRDRHASLAEVEAMSDKWKARALKAEGVIEKARANKKSIVLHMYDDDIERLTDRLQEADGLLDRLLRAAQIDGRFDWREVERHLRGADSDVS